MSAGCAVIATDAGAIPEVVKDGETGLLVPQGDPVTLADALERLFRSPELRREMGKRAQEFVRLEFSPERSTLLLARWFRDSRRDQQTTARAQQSLDWAAAKRQIVDKDRRKRS